MKGCQEYRRIIDRYRAREARFLRRQGRKPNGATGALDDLWLEKLFYNSKRRFVRTKRIDIVAE